MRRGEKVLKEKQGRKRKNVLTGSWLKKMVEGHLVNDRDSTYGGILVEQGHSSGFVIGE